MALLDNFKPRQSALFSRLGPFLGASFLIIIFFLVSNITSALSARRQVLGDAQDAYSSLNTAYSFLNQSDLGQAGVHFSQAAGNFAKVSESLAALAKTLEPLRAETLTTALHIARAGQAISAAGDYLSSGLTTFLVTAAELAKLEILEVKSPGNSAGADIAAILKKSQLDFSWSRDLVVQAEAEFIQASPEVLKQMLPSGTDSIKSSLESLSLMLKVLTDFNSLLSEMTSGGHQQNFVFLFQNNAEARPGGGFIGSYGALKLSAGRLSSLLIESIYELDGRLTEKIAPPEPLKFVAGDAWAMRDANWWPDFKTSAENISKFYELEAGLTPDAILAFTPEVFEKMIAATGPVSMPEYGLTVNSSNFYDTVQEQTSEAYDKELNRPKKFMADLGREILKIIPTLPNEKKLQIIGGVLQNIYQKNIMLYSRQPEIQIKIESLGLGGRLESLPPGTDSLLVSHANVGGGKSDRYVRNNLNLDVTVLASGRINHKLTLSRANLAPAQLPNGTNVDYLRVYAPLGAKFLQSSRDFQVFEELDRTAFATTLRLERGETEELTLEYELPISYFRPNSYGIILEKNPGQTQDFLGVNITLRDGARILHNIGGNVRAKNILHAEYGPFNYNEFIGLIYE